MLAAGVFAACAAGAQSPASQWRTIDTAHFRVHFPLEFEPWARRAAGAIEGIHDRVTEAVGYRTTRPIDVVVADPQATANGMAFPFLDRPAIVLWTSPPEPESAIGHWTDWMEDLVTHEVAHIVHLARPRNRSRGILARLSPLPVGPLMLNSPRWLAEGYATVIEGSLTGSGRPASSLRAMVLRRFAIEGKLPGYGALSATSGWLGGSMAYLVGSTFLEWLEAREGPGTLRKLWRRMASRRGGDFPTAFRAVFGRSPGDLYDRFRAEITAAGIEEERRMTAAGLVAGEPWQRLEGGTLSPQVSPDGTKLLARRDPKRGETYLAVWSLGETEEDREAEKRRLEREAEILRDPEEVADRVELPRRRSPKWRLPSANGFAADNPRWLPDGERVLFSRRSPDAEGLLRLDLYAWRPETGDVDRITRLADVAEADPAPDGAWAVGVRNRYGVSELVRVDLASGDTRPIPAGGPTEPWRVWIHPRVSPDGASIASLLHSGGRWRLVTLSVAGGAPTEIALPGPPAGEPAWSPDGSRIYVAADREGVWNVESADARSGGPSQLLTRVTGGALGPAPSPAGDALFFLEITAKGVDVRRLSLPATALTPVARRPASFPLLPPDPVPVSPFARSDPGPARAYRLWPSHVIRPLATYSVGPDGNAWQLGVEGTDVLGRLDWVAAASVGSDAGPRGGSIAASYRGLPVALSVHAFYAREKPGSQRVVRRPDLDSERLGGFLEGVWSRPSAGGRLLVAAGGGASRVEALASGDEFDRALFSARARATGRRVRGKSGFGGEFDITGSTGRTDGRSWTQVLAGAGVTAYLPPARISASARWGDTSGSPTLFDLFGVGGASSSVLPSGFDRNRIEVAALPAFVHTGERVESARGELALAALPIVVYGERLRAWNPGGEKPDPVRVLGAELRIDERILPIPFPGDLAFYAGVAKIKSESPRFDSTRGYAGLLYRP